MIISSPPLPFLCQLIIPHFIILKTPWPNVSQLGWVFATSKRQAWRDKELNPVSQPRREHSSRIPTYKERSMQPPKNNKIIPSLPPKSLCKAPTFQCGFADHFRSAWPACAIASKVVGSYSSPGRRPQELRSIKCAVSGNIAECFDFFYFNLMFFYDGNVEKEFGSNRESICSYLAFLLISLLLFRDSCIFTEGCCYGKDK